MHLELLVLVGVVVATAVLVASLFLGVPARVPALYWRYFRIWVTLGVPAFIAFVVIFWLMVAKPA